MLINKAILIGNLGKDPEISHTPGGLAVAKFSIATSEKWKDDSGQQQEKTEWHNIVAWRKLAEVCAQYLKKGSKVYVEGKITTRSWEDKNGGGKKYMTEIVAHEIQFLSAMKNAGTEVAPSDTSSPSPPNDDLPF